jgi:two-component system, NarL family, nitrate/nitrite response regulator NarL
MSMPEPKPQPRVRVLLVDDHAVFRECVALALGAEPDLEIAHCGSVADALVILQQEPADIVLLDHDLGVERGWQFFPQASRAGFGGRVLIVTAWISDGEAHRLLRAGAAGIFRKESPLSALANAIRTVAAGGIWLDERYAAVRRKTGDGHIDSAGGQPRLSEKERKVLRLVLEGLSNKEIAWRLTLSESYVKAIMQRLFNRTGVRTRGQLVRVALEKYSGQI